MRNFYVTEKEKNLIASTPPKECWICNKVINCINKNEIGYFLKEKNIINDGFKEHLKQIINREVIFK